MQDSFPCILIYIFVLCKAQGFSNSPCVYVYISSWDNQFWLCGDTHFFRSVVITSYHQGNAALKVGSFHRIFANARALWCKPCNRAITWAGYETYIPLDNARRDSWRTSTLSCLLLHLLLYGCFKQLFFILCLFSVLCLICMFRSHRLPHSLRSYRLLRLIHFLLFLLYRSLLLNARRECTFASLPFFAYASQKAAKTTGFRLVRTTRPSNCE